LEASDYMVKQGWHNNPIQKPTGIQFSVTCYNADKVELWVKDLKAAIEYVKANPSKEQHGAVAMYCSTQKFPKEFIDDSGKIAFDAMYQI